jgi:hypothetical protein
MQHLRRALLAVVATVGALAVFAPASFAAPNPGFEAFVGCPNAPQVFFCIRSETNGGHIQIGSKDVPINQQVVFSGGVINDFSTIQYTAQGGLQSPPLRVPGGLVGLTGISEFIINLITFGANNVYAKTELVGVPHAVNFLEGLQLPVQVKLQNPFLTSSCSIGTAANPVTFNLTTGTTAPPPPNTPISGHLNDGFDDPTNPLVLLFPNNTYVDNAFAAPAVNNCGLFTFGLINAAVNLTSGLPSAAGRNTAVLSSTNVRLTAKSNVYTP